MMKEIIKIVATFCICIFMWYCIVIVETPPPSWDRNFKKVNTAMFISGTLGIIVIWMHP